MPSKKKKFNSRFPPARIKKIMQTDEDVGKVAAAVPVIISRALEMFIESLILKSGETTMSRNAKTLSTSHIKQTIASEKKFDFLHDLVANIPDHQPEEEGESSKPERVKGKVGRPRKNKDGDEPARPRKRKNRQKSSDSSEGNENDNDAEHDNSSTESDNDNHEDHDDNDDYNHGSNGDERLNNTHNHNPFSHENVMGMQHPGYGMGMPPPMGAHHYNSNMIPTPAMGVPGMPPPNFNMMPHLPHMQGLPPGMPPPPFPPMGYPPFDRMPYPIPHMSHPQFTQHSDPHHHQTSSHYQASSSSLSSSSTSTTTKPSATTSSAYDESSSVYPTSTTSSSQQSSSHQLSTTDEDDDYDT